VAGRRDQFQAKLKEYYGIDYRAPCDAKLTGIEPNSIDVITSTSTLEHIPLRSIQLILQECRRILRDDGLVSFIIDYTDHYAYFDSSISSYNYLKYSDTRWALFNSGLHFQNRLRHCDYLDLFRAAAFEVVDEQHPEATDTEMTAIARLPLAKKFACYALRELAVPFSLTLVRKVKHLYREIADTTADDTLVRKRQ
jgi:ubiquinone/menaquinone biosynthesis C-methylase UbiE